MNDAPGSPGPLRAPETIDPAEIPLFRDVEPAALASALRDCEVLDLPGDTILLRPGQANDRIYVILSGKVMVYLDAEPEGRGQGIPIPLGECIGEFSAIDGMPVSALVRVESLARVLCLSSKIFWSRLVGLPGVARNMMRSLTSRTRLTNRLALEAQRERLELAQLRKELNLARELQAGMLPLERPLFPGRSDIEVCALMEPASTVGGDFFDAFFVDGDTLFLCIGDVSGHGIGAALLMARTIGLLRILAITERAPHELLARLNTSLVEGNDTAAFVTLFCGFLEVSSGRFRYSNGGHCPPLLVGVEGVRNLPVPRGMLVGAFPERTYHSLSLTLAPGEGLFLYTDGITEAENAAGEPFSVEGCRRLLLRERSTPLPRLLDQLREEVTRFTDRPSLEDDGTALAVRRPAGAPA